MKFGVRFFTALGGQLNYNLNFLIEFCSCLTYITCRDIQ